MDIFNEIKSRINCVEYARNNGLPISKDGDRCASFIEPGSNKTAVSIRTDYWHDFKVDAGGDVIDLCAELHYGGDKRQALEELTQSLGIDSDSSFYRNWEQETQNLCNQAEYWRKSLRDSDREYLHRRNINNETIERLKIGYSEKMNRIMIPYFKNRAVVYWIGRRLDEKDSPKYRKAKKNGINENVPWGLQTLNRDKPLIICEGALDAVSFEQEGYPVLATMGGSFSYPQFKEVCSICKDREEIILAFDNDDAGTSFFFKLAESLINNGIYNFRRALIPKEDGKDVNDYYIKNNTLEPLVQDAQHGLAEFCRDINEKEFQKLASRIGRNMKKVDVQLWFSKMKQFNQDWLKELLKEVTRVPSESEVADEVKNKHSLIYNEKIGFHEYNGVYWESVSESAVQGYIGDVLKIHETGSRLTSILKVVKERTNNDKFELNKSRVFNFRNGTLDLETLELRDHKQSDNCGYVVDYDYDPEAEAEHWYDFVFDVTNGDMDRIDVLQCFAGYILSPDVSMRKFLYLYGPEASNGKSTFLLVLNELFPNELTSTVSINEMSQPFERIRLMNAMVNLVGEAPSSVKDVETFKKIVTGDPISARYLYKNSIEFIPRTKHIVASNHMLRPRDDSDGFLDRALFVKFEKKFVDDPDSDKPNQAKRDPGIIKTLLSEKSGIFNWIVEGYSRLKKIGRFPYCADQNELRNEMARTINPVIDFIENEFDISQYNGFVSYSRAYLDYRAWSDECGYQLTNRNTFSKRFGKEFLKLYGKNWQAMTRKIGGKAERGFIRVTKPEECDPERNPERNPGEEFQQGYTLQGSKIEPNFTDEGERVTERAS